MDEPGIALLERTTVWARHVRKSVIRVFEIGDEWWAGLSERQVAEAFSEAYDLPIEESEPVELSRELMSKLRYWDVRGRTISFERHLDKLIEEGADFPCIFAYEV